MGSSITSSARLWQLAGLNGLATLVLLVSYAVNAVDTTAALGCAQQVLDFHVFWNAGGLALEGRPLDAFDYDVLDARYNPCGDDWLPWLHPPPAMALLMPFAALPLVPAWIAFNLFSLGLFGLALRPFTAGISAMWLLMLLAPAHLAALLAGQFTPLWMAGLLLALQALRQERWVLAGVIFGCLTIKPPLGLMIPVALLAIGTWRTVFAATVTTVVLQGSTLMIFGGFAYLAGLSAYYEELAMRAANDMTTGNLMVSITSVLTRAGFLAETALRLNLLVTALMTLVVFIVWRKLGPKSDAGAAVLTASIPLATPYLWHYDSAFLALSALFLARHMNFAPGGATKVLLSAMWFGSGFSIWLFASNITDALPPILTVPPLLLLAFAASLYHSALAMKEVP